MQTSLPSASLAFGLLALITGCGSDPAHPSEKECQTGCSRLAGWQIAADKHDRGLIVHEADEAVDETEDRVRDDSNAIRAEIAAGYPPINPKRLEGLTPAQRKSVVDTYEWDQNQLKLQRADALKKGDAAVAEAKARYQEKLKAFQDWEKQALADAVGKCMPVCMARPTAYALCLQKTQAPEDADVCAKQ